jgi:glycosyltransferase involved in cell wall biosynthesis
MDENKFSAIITCYNEEKFISATIDSVLHQTRTDLINEIIVVDDGSKDNSKEQVLKKVEESNKVKYIYQENKGLAGARNTGIRHTTGDYIAILDGDDLWIENKIEIISHYIKEYPNVGLFYSNTYRYLYQKGKLLPLRVNKYHYDQVNLLPTFLAKGGPIVPSSAIIKKECFETLGLFDENFRMAEDTDMWLRIATKYPFHHIEEYLIKKRTVENSLGSNTVENAKYYKMALDKIEALVPGLKPYRRKRDILIHYKVGLYYYNINKWRLARKEAKVAIVKGKTLFKAYLLWIATLIKPFFKIDIIRFLKQL